MIITRSSACPPTLGYVFRFVSNHVLQRVQMTICSYAKTRMRFPRLQVYGCCVLDNFSSMDDMRTSRPQKDSEALIHSHVGDSAFVIQEFCNYVFVVRRLLFHEPYNEDHGRSNLSHAQGDTVDHMRHVMHRGFPLSMLASRSSL